MKKLFICITLALLNFFSFGQTKPEFTTITGKVFFKNKYTLVNNIINVMGSNEASIISDNRDASGGRNYSLEVPKNTDVYVTINKAYIAKINSGLKNNDIYIFDGEKDQTKRYLAEWNKNKQANELFFDKIYKGRFNSKAMYESNDGITISEPLEKPSSPKRKIDLENDLFDFIDANLDHTPKFPGGEKKFEEYVKNNMIYPPAAKENNVQGKIYVQFIVEKDGSISDIKIPRSLGSGCDEEALRLIKASGKWEPATSTGIKVRCKYTTRINFSLF